MNRRRVLQLTASAGIAVLAGCSSASGPNYLDRYRERLQSGEVEISRLAVDDGIVSLEYYSEETEKYKITGIETVVGAYARYDYEGWDVTRLDVRVLSMDDDLTATYYVDDEMVEKIASGELGDRELGEMLFSTVEMES